MSFDAPTHAIPRDQNSVYQSIKDYKSDTAFRNADKDSQYSGTDAKLMKVKGKGIEQEIMVRGIKGLPEPINDNNDNRIGSQIKGNNS